MFPESLHFAGTAIKKGAAACAGTGASTRSPRGQAAGPRGTRRTRCHSVSGSPSGCLTQRICCVQTGRCNTEPPLELGARSTRLPSHSSSRLDKQRLTRCCGHWISAGGPDAGTFYGLTAWATRPRRGRRAGLPVRWLRGGQLRAAAPRPAGEVSHCHSVTVPFPGCQDATRSSCSSCLRGTMSLFCGSLEMTVSLVLFCPRILQSVEMRRLLRPEIFIKTFIQQSG